MQALVELYDAENLPRVLDAGATLVGVNNRDLRSFAVRLEHTLELAARDAAGRVPGERERHPRRAATSRGCGPAACGRCWWARR